MVVMCYWQVKWVLDNLKSVKLRSFFFFFFKFIFDQIRSIDVGEAMQGLGGWKNK